MIIQCQSCSRKFQVKERDIPQEGRMVQCGYCSQKWFQTPIKDPSPVRVKTKENISKTEIEASDGKTYKFLGKQWAELLPSGKTGMLAKKKIAIELNKLTGTNEQANNEHLTEFALDPSSEKIETEKTKKSLGFFGYVFLFIIIAFSAIGILKTFEKELLTHIPKSTHIFELLEEQAKYFLESIKNITTIIKDLIDYY